MRSDDDLVRALVRGDRRALGDLFERHRDFVFRVALGMTGSRDDAVEIVQETFLALLERAASLDPERGRITTWLFEVARRRAADRARKRRPSSPRPDWTRAAESPTPEASALRSERREALHREVAKLPARPREVFVLRVGLGLSVEETARTVGCEPGAVRTALYEANRRLREALAGAGKGGADVRACSSSTE